MRVEDVLFRAGTVNGKGQQKGVDSLIVTDLIELAGNHAIVDAMVITGDSDLAVGIDLAQRKGVRIAVMGVHDSACGVAPNLSFEITSRADRVTSIGLTDVQRYFAYGPRPNVVASVSVPPAATGPATAANMPAIAAAVRAFISANQAIKQTSLAANGSIPQQTDGLLLHSVYTALGNKKLSSEERLSAREIFRQELRKP